MTERQDPVLRRVADPTGAVTVAVGADGRPVHIDIGAHAYRLGASELSRRITTACRLAAATVLGDHRRALAAAGAEPGLLDRAGLPDRAAVIAAEHAAGDGAVPDLPWRVRR